MPDHIGDNLPFFLWLQEFFSTSEEVNKSIVFDIRTDGSSLLTSFLAGCWWHIFGSKGHQFSELCRANNTLTELEKM